MSNTTARPLMRSSHLPLIWWGQRMVAYGLLTAWVGNGCPAGRCAA